MCYWHYFKLFLFFYTLSQEKSNPDPHISMLIRIRAVFLNVDPDTKNTDYREIVGMTEDFVDPWKSLQN